MGFRFQQALPWIERGIRHVWEREEVHAVFWWGDEGERVHLEDLGVDGVIILK